MMKIPLVDLKWQVDQILPEVRPELERAILTTSFVLSQDVVDFEEAYAAYSGVRRCVGVGNGTDAIELALRAAGVGEGDEVILPANTFVATVEGVVRAGATPVLADCTSDFLLDPGSVAEKLTRRTRAVIPVHLYGQMAPVDLIQEVIPDSVAIVEDAAQSQGATRHGLRSGSIGRVAATSFYPGKNLGAFGDAGAVTTDDEDLASRVEELRSHGGTRRYEHLVVGTNSRLDGLQAVVLSAKLARLDEWNRLRSEAASSYASLLAHLDPVQLPKVISGNEHVWHLYVVRVPRRSAVIAELEAKGIAAAVHYPAPLHCLPPFRQLGALGDFPVAEQLSTEILTLPLYPGITASQQERVAQALGCALTRLPAASR